MARRRVVETTARVETRRRLRFFYRHVIKTPSKLENLEAWLSKYSGRERSLISKINAQYKSSSKWVPNLSEVLAADDGVTTTFADRTAAAATAAAAPVQPDFASPGQGGSRAAAYAASATSCSASSPPSSKTLDLGDYVARLAATSLDRTPIQGAAPNVATRAPSTPPPPRFALLVESKQRAPAVAPRGASPQWSADAAMGSTASRSSPSELFAAREEFREAFDALIHLHSRSSHPRAAGCVEELQVKNTPPPFQGRPVIRRTPPGDIRVEDGDAAATVPPATIATIASPISSESVAKNPPAMLRAAANAEVMNTANEARGAISAQRDGAAHRRWGRGADGQWRKRPVPAEEDVLPVVIGAESESETETAAPVLAPNVAVASPKHMRVAHAALRESQQGAFGLPLALDYHEEDGDDADATTTASLEANPVLQLDSTLSRLTGVLASIDGKLTSGSVASPSPATASSVDNEEDGAMPIPGHGIGTDAAALSHAYRHASHDDNASDDVNVLHEGVLIGCDLTPYARAEMASNATSGVGTTVGGMQVQPLGAMTFRLTRRGSLFVSTGTGRWRCFIPPNAVVAYALIAAELVISYADDAEAQGASRGHRRARTAEMVVGFTGDHERERWARALRRVWGDPIETATSSSPVHSDGYAPDDMSLAETETEGDGDTETGTETETETDTNEFGTFASTMDHGSSSERDPLPVATRAKKSAAKTFTPTRAAVEHGEDRDDSIAFLAQPKLRRSPVPGELGRASGGSAVRAPPLLAPTPTTSTAARLTEKRSGSALSPFAASQKTKHSPPKEDEHFVERQQPPAPSPLQVATAGDVYEMRGTGWDHRTHRLDALRPPVPSPVAAVGVSPTSPYKIQLEASRAAVASAAFETMAAERSLRELQSTSPDGASANRYPLQDELSLLRASQQPSPPSPPPSPIIAASHRGGPPRRDIPRNTSDTAPGAPSLALSWPPALSPEKPHHPSPYPPPLNDAGGDDLGGIWDNAASLDESFSLADDYEEIARTSEEFAAQAEAARAANLAYLRAAGTPRRAGGVDNLLVRGRKLDIPASFDYGEEVERIANISITSSEGDTTLETTFDGGLTGGYRGLGLLTTEDGASLDVSIDTTIEDGYSGEVHARYSTTYNMLDAQAGGLASGEQETLAAARAYLASSPALDAMYSPAGSGDLDLSDAMSLEMSLDFEMSKFRDDLDATSTRLGSLLDSTRVVGSALTSLHSAVEAGSSGIPSFAQRASKGVNLEVRGVAATLHAYDYAENVQHSSVEEDESSFSTEASSRSSHGTADTYSEDEGNAERLERERDLSAAIALLNCREEQAREELAALEATVNGHERGDDADSISGWIGDGHFAVPVESSAALHTADVLANDGTAFQLDAEFTPFGPARLPTPNSNSSDACSDQELDEAIDAVTPFDGDDSPRVYIGTKTTLERDEYYLSTSSEEETASARRAVAALQTPERARRVRTADAMPESPRVEVEVLLSPADDASGSRSMTRSASYLTAAQEGPASAHKPRTPRALSALLNPTATDDGTRFALLSPASREASASLAAASPLANFRVPGTPSFRSKAARIAAQGLAVRGHGVQLVARPVDYIEEAEEVDEMLARGYDEVVVVLTSSSEDEDDVELVDSDDLSVLTEDEMSYRESRSSRHDFSEMTDAHAELGATYSSRLDELQARISQATIDAMSSPLAEEDLSALYSNEEEEDASLSGTEETTDEEESSSLFPYSLLPSSFPRAQFLEGEGSVAINAALSSFSPRREHAFDTAEAAITDSDDYERYAMIDSFSSEEIETSLPLSPAAKSRGLRVEYKLDGTPIRSPEGGAEALMASSPMSISDHESESWQREPRTTYALSSSSDEDESR